MKKIIFLALFYQLFISGFAQNFSSLSGKVIDAKTKEPLPGAVVYLANTVIGTSANADGSFELTKIPPGKYDLSVSMIGYKSVSQPIIFSGNSVYDYLITMTDQAVLLKEVTVVAHQEKQRHSDYAKFVRTFLGQTRNANKCRILNPQDIIVYTDHNKLIAEATKPIIIENKALGYFIHYDLQEFSSDQLLHTVTFSGIPRFQEITPSGDTEKVKWDKERDRAYFGSSRHFLLSLRQNELESNYFAIRDITGKVLAAHDLVTDSILHYKTKVYVSFSKELPEINYPFKSNEQHTDITFTGAPIQIYSNGYFEDFHSLIFGGYIGWSSAVAELVPLGYCPTKKIKKK